jgi:hypothetical protein
MATSMAAMASGNFCSASFPLVSSAWLALADASSALHAHEQVRLEESIFVCSGFFFCFVKVLFLEKPFFSKS